ncbi:MAG: hypothetical protein L3J45_00950 [Flavobacteriaceae bacterium]|nr:hypothetical protein [Flavobacteriaceae bacterium]
MSLFKSSILVSALSLLISIISFGNQVVIANFFGAGNDMDIYLLASSIPIMIGGLISSALSYSLIPHIIAKEISLGSNFKSYFSQFFKVNVVLLFLSTLLLGLVFYFLMPLIYTSLSKEGIIKARLIGIISWINFFVSTSFSILICLLNAKKRFLIPLLLSMLPFVMSLLFTIVFYKYFGIVVIAIGLTFGTTMALSIGIYKTKKDIDLKFYYHKVYNSEIVKFIKYLRFPILAMLSFSIYQSIDAFWATKLGTSALSYLGYSQRILIAMGSLVIVGPSIVLIPRLTEAIQEKRELDYYKDTSLVIKLVLALTSVFAVVVGVLSKPIVKILLERGSFNNIATDGVSHILPFMLTGMVFMLSVVVSFRALFVREMGFSVAIIGIYTVMLYFGLSGVLSSLFNIEGIGTAYIITWVIIFFITLKKLFLKQKNIFFNSELFSFFWKQIISLVVVFLTTYYLSYIFNDSLKSDQFYKVVLSTFTIAFLSFSSYFLLSIVILKIKEIDYFFRKILELKFNKNDA